MGSFRRTPSTPPRSALGVDGVACGSVAAHPEPANAATTLNAEQIDVRDSGWLRGSLQLGRRRVGSDPFRRVMTIHDNRATFGKERVEREERVDQADAKTSHLPPRKWRSLTGLPPSSS